MIWAAMNVMPTMAGVLLMAGIMAAGLSSASTFLSLIDFSASNDIFSHHDRDNNDKKRLRASRFAVFFMGLLALALAWPWS